MNDLENELGFNPITTSKQLDAIIDLIPEKIQRIRELKNELQTFELRLNEKNKIVNEFITKMSDLNAIVDENSASLIQSSIKNAMLEESEHANIQEKLKE